MKIRVALLLELAFALFTSVHGFTSVSVSASVGILGGTAVYYMLTQTNRGTLGEILAGKRCPILENGTKDQLLYLDTYKWDGETRTTVAGILYFYSLLVSNSNTKPPTDASNPVIETSALPWGTFDINNDPLKETGKIREYLESVSGGFVRLNITDVDDWNLFPIGIARFISENREKTINTVEESLSNTLNKAKKVVSSDKKKTVKEEEKRDPKEGLLDMSNVAHRRAISSRSPIHVIRDNPKVHYTSPAWAPQENTSWGELNAIYNYLEQIVSDKEIITKDNIIKRNKNIERFSLALILYWRERQFDISAIEPINYDSSKFRKSLGAFERSYAAITDVASLGHGKRNGVRVAPWKLIPDSMWKHSPFQSFERVVFSVYSDEIKKSKYNSLNWNVYDFSIGVVLNTFSRELGVHTVFGQYKEKVSKWNKLLTRNPLKMKRYSLQGDSYTEEKKPSKKKSMQEAQEGLEEIEQSAHISTQRVVPEESNIGANLEILANSTESEDSKSSKEVQGPENSRKQKRANKRKNIKAESTGKNKQKKT
ncbi:ATP-dependent RNA helicase [Cryptosporidium felis]|nr:ATP-dependent RNA helicase [Cryptosporidium felis]